MAGLGIVLGGHPPVVTVVPGLGLGGLIEDTIEVPLAAVTGVIAGLLQEPGQGDLTTTQVNLGTFGNPSVDSVAVWSAPCEDR